jgi:hypothetical protein
MAILQTVSHLVVLVEAGVDYSVQMEVEILFEVMAAAVHLLMVHHGEEYGLPRANGSKSCEENVPFWR